MILIIKIVGQVDTSTFQFDNNVLVKGNVEVQGNLTAPTTGDRITIETGTDATTGFLLLDSSAKVIMSSAKVQM